jgi:arylsulfatase A-like enzyme
MRWQAAMLTGALIALGCGSDSEGEIGAAGDPPESAADDEPAAELPQPDPAPLPPERTVFRLTDNRLLAHRLRGGAPLVDAGDPGFVRYTRFHRLKRGGLRWSAGHRVDGVAVARPDRDSELVVLLTAEQATAPAITFRLHTPEERNLHVGVNKSMKDDGTHLAKLTEGWQTVTVPVGDGELRAGLNRIALRRSHGSPLSIAWVQIGGDDGGDPIAPLYDEDADRLALARGDSVVYYVQVPDAGSLVADVDGCELAVTAETDGGARVSGSLGTADARVDVSELAGEVARLVITNDACRRATFDAALTVPGPDPDLHGGPAPKYVVLWVMDTLRGDKVRLVNPEARAEIPNLTRLADSGAVFRQYYVQGNESQTSHSSVWTSLYPANHRVITSGRATNYVLAKRFDKIGELMKAAGKRTVGVTANGTIFDWSGYTEGFDVFNNLMKDGTGRKLGFRVPGNVVYDRALDKLAYDDHPDEPFFLFIGTIDTHKPWYGHEPWLSRYDPEPYDGRFQSKVFSAALDIPRGTHICRWHPPEREMQRIHAIYDSAISFQDAQVGKLLDQLEAWGIRDQTMIIVTADHGEELWEYPQRCGHGSSLRETLVHVPLLIHYPPLIPGTVVEEGADGVDILPTVLDALGREPLAQAQGASLIPLAQGAGRGYPRPSYASMNEWTHTMRLGRWKATVTKAGLVRLHDMETDPFERDDQADARPFVRQMLSDALAVFVPNRKRWNKRLWGVASNMTARGAAELEGRGRAGEPAPRDG